jgi:hypothetical protein
MEGVLAVPRDYGKIRHGFWSGTGETGRELRKLPIEVRTVAAYLMSCGSSNMIGLYYLPLPIIAHEIGSGLTTEGALKALRSLYELGFANYDEQAETVFVTNMAREQIGKTLEENDKQRGGVIALLREYEKSRFVADFVRIYGAAYHLPDGLSKHVPSEPLRSPIEGPSMPESREQRAGDQEEIPPSAGACDPVAGGTEPPPPPAAPVNVNAKSAYDWLAYFRVRYWEIRKRQYGQGSADAKALANFADLLESLPAGQRASDWLDRDRIVTEFLNRADARTVKSGWPFCFFATDFRGLATPPGQRPQQPSPPSFGGGFRRSDSTQTVGRRTPQPLHVAPKTEPKARGWGDAPPAAAVGDLVRGIAAEKGSS